MEKIAELYFLPGGPMPQALGLPGDDALAVEGETTSAVAVVTAGKKVGRTDKNGFPTGYPDIPDGEEWFEIFPRASQDGVFDAYWLLERVALSRFKATWNKSVAIATLNTWFFVAVVGNNGGIRRKFLIRHTLPNGTPARWELWVTDKGLQLRRPTAAPKPS
jgi:hypothetical protein